MLAAAREVDPDIIIVDAKTMDRHLAIMLLPARMGAVIFGAFATLALILALVGVYGVVSYAVSRRLREVGIRMSLGARPGEMVRLLMGAGFTLVGIGAFIGIAISLVTARVLSIGTLRHRTDRSHHVHRRTRTTACRGCTRCLDSRATRQQGRPGSGIDQRSL